MKYFVPFTMVAFLGSLFVGGQALAVENGAVQSPAFQDRAGPASPDDTMGRAAEQQQVSLEQLDSEKVRKLQQALQDQGADPGPIDGIVGPETREALRDFQQEEGIAATGQLDRQTVEALDLDVQEFMGVAPGFGDQQQRRDQQQQRDRDMNERRDRDMNDRRGTLDEQQRDQQRDGRLGVQQRNDQRQVGAQDRVDPEQLTSSQVRDLQQALQRKGADPGPIDGIMGPMTREGIREFQQDEGIAATGQLDRETLEALDLDVQEYLGVAPPFEEEERRMEMEREREVEFDGMERRENNERNGLMGR